MIMMCVQIQRMKKQNRNILAYARKPKQTRLNKINDTNKTEVKGSSQSIYQTIMDQMESNQWEYINKLISKGDKDDKYPKNKKKLVNTHERTKSYANILLENLAKTDHQSRMEKQNRSPQERSTNWKDVTQKTKNFYSHQPSPQKFNKIQSINQKLSEERSFLINLDKYIKFLSPSDFKQNLNRESEEETDKLQDSQLRMYRELKLAEKKIRELKSHVQFMKIQEKRYMKKNRSLKQKIFSMEKHIDHLTHHLFNERYERKKMEKYFRQFEKNFQLVHPQRKTIGPLWKTSKRGQLMEEQWVKDRNFEHRAKSTSKAGCYGLNQQKMLKYYRDSQYFEDSDESSNTYDI